MQVLLKGLLVRLHWLVVLRFFSGLVQGIFRNIVAQKPFVLEQVEVGFALLLLDRLVDDEIEVIIKPDAQLESAGGEADGVRAELQDGLLVISRPLRDLIDLLLQANLVVRKASLLQILIHPGDIVFAGGLAGHVHEVPPEGGEGEHRKN